MNLTELPRHSILYDATGILKARFLLKISKDLRVFSNTARLRVPRHGDAGRSVICADVAKRRGVSPDYRKGQPGFPARSRYFVLHCNPGGSGMDRVNLASSDRDFIRQVEEESGQTISRCYQCGNCTAGCPMGFAYDLPVHRIMRMIQTGQKEAVLSSKSLWYCATCEACTARCPNKIDVATIMDVCRHMARRENRLGVWSVRVFTRSFLETVKYFGRTHELGTMAGFMLGTGRLLTDTDLVPKILPKKKLALKPHTIKAREEVSGIFKRFRESQKEGNHGK